MKKTAGKYNLGPHKVEVILNFASSDGFFSTYGGDKDNTFIEIGCRLDWARTMTVLIHEVLELAFADMNGRFVPCPDYAEASDGYIFHMNHPAFSEASARVGYFLANSLPDISKVYNANKKKGKR